MIKDIVQNIIITIFFNLEKVWFLIFTKIRNFID